VQCAQFAHAVKPTFDAIESFHLHMTYRLEITTLRWLDASAGAASLLTQSHHGEAPENEDHKETIRQKLFKTKPGSTYRRLYIIRVDVIYIIYVRGAGQDVMRPTKSNYRKLRQPVI
jgi:hypothetical protein